MTYTHNSSYLKWEQNNDGKFVRIPVGSNIEVGVDFRNIIADNDQITTVTATSSSSDITVSRTLAVRNKDIRSTPHQAVVFVQPSATGVHRIKLTANTNLGETYVYRFDVLTER